MAEQYLVAAEGFDIYTSGTIAANYPWYVTNTSLAGQINASGGAFGGGALTFPATGSPSTSTSGFEYQFPSTLQQVQGGTVATGNSGVFSFSGWINVTSMTANTAGTLFGIGSSTGGSAVQPLLNISNANSSGLNLQFVTNANNSTSVPYNYNIQFNTYYWIQIQIAWYATSATVSVMRASFSVNGAQVQTDIPMTWNSNNFAAGQILNRVKFYASNFVTYFIDDMVIQAVSGADSRWPLAAGTNPTPELIPAMPPRRIYAVPATGAGSSTQWTPSGSEPNWQSATDATGTNFVTAQASGLLDTYKWNCPAVTDVRAVVLRGSSNRYQNVNGAFKTNSTSSVTTIPTNSNASRHISVSETIDGTNAWTQTSINAAEFGPLSN